ncbi:hypothetical protein CERSUDRAFT_90469 [Gelatoporia subvermispora B]|uniref:EthD domain-containing protein n=1 Tax=Ceriporiopsis subvermispora (strain B) TaxID=914234 RepID=M2RSI4_CERS8|nr:hypothetical protein CERSUDRAFT_90469 [Gelatoporia subvermispora B]
MAPPGFLLVFSEPGELVSEAEFHDWYDNEHIPLRVAVPAFLSWMRWEAVDGSSPKWGASYDIESFEATQTPPYSTLAQTRSDREKNLQSRIKRLDRRTYEVFEGHPAYPPSSLFDPNIPAPYTMFFSIDVKPEDEEGLNKWYYEEHIPMVSKSPGWLRSRRFVLKDWGKIGVEGKNDQKAPPKYLAVHEWTNPDFLQSDELKAASTTTLAKKFLDEAAVSQEMRVMKLHKKWDRQ